MKRQYCESLLTHKISYDVTIESQKKNIFQEYKFIEEDMTS